MRGAYKIVNDYVDQLTGEPIRYMVDIGLALGMQMPWTYEMAERVGADLYSVDINLKSFFERSLHKYLPPKGEAWSQYRKTSDHAELGYEPDVVSPLAWDDLLLVNAEPPIYSYGVDRHRLGHAHSTKFLEWFPHDIDVALIDGDHRYVTVWNDLELFRRKNGRLAFFDDIDTLFARHEVSMSDYKDHPDVELEAEGQSWNVKGPGGTYYKEILEGAGARAHEVGLDAFEKTHSEAGKEGVLTAIEDFVETYKHEYAFTIHETGAGGKSTITGTYKQCGVLRRIED